VDTYLRPNVQEEQVFQEAVGTLKCTRREGIMQIVKSWIEQGIAEREQCGKTEGERSLIFRQLIPRMGILPASVIPKDLALPQFEALGEALLDFVGLDDLVGWLRGQ
jgi:Domain of unknown function (DUF4351)